MTAGTIRERSTNRADGSSRPAGAPLSNDDVARRLDELARVLDQQGANAFRIRAYRLAAETLRRLPVPVSELFADQGLEGLERLPQIGPAIARAIRDVLVWGRLPMLDRLRGESDPVGLLASIPGVGARMAERLHHELGIGTLEDLEVAAHDGRLERFRGIGPKRLAGIRSALAQRLGRARTPRQPAQPEPTVGEILDIDREYREKADEGLLPRIAPRRFNPGRRAWLPILHSSRGPRHYTALFSNTATAHRLNRTHDWVVIYYDGGREEHQCTVVTARVGPLAGRRAVRGREAECLTHYKLRRRPPVPEEALP
jgi:Holliday junction resolvasome RuvABC DNA-binding subunit